MELKNKSFAVVGASNNPEKYGYKIVDSLKRISKNVFPINLKEKEILGLKVSKSVQEVKQEIDFVVFVVPPQVTLKVLNELNGKKFHFWFQPGSFDNKVINYCQKNRLAFTSDKCIIVESEKIS